jgi:hypothetical protein
MEMVFGVWLMFRRILQGFVANSTDWHDSEHRGPAVVAYETVSWKGGGLMSCSEQRGIAVFSSTFAGTCGAIN